MYILRHIVSATCSLFAEAVRFHSLSLTDSEWQKLFYMLKFAVVIQEAFWIEATRFREVARIHVNTFNIGIRVKVLGYVIVAKRRRRQRSVWHSESVSESE